MILSDPWRVQIAMLPIRREYEIEKQRTATALQRMAAGRASAHTIAKKKHAENRQAIIDALKTPLTTGQIIIRTGLSEECIRQHLLKLVASGMTEKPRKGRPWRLTCK